MLNDLNKHIDFKQVRKIISKHEADLEEWLECIEIPFTLLDKNSTYCVTYIIVKQNSSCGYSHSGSPKSLYTQLVNRIEEALQVFLAISGDNNQKDCWFISRD